VFRAVVWRVTGNYQRATSSAATTSCFFGFVPILLGVWHVLGGHLINGLWVAFIGWFLESAAGRQLQTQVLRSVLGDHTLLDAMKRDFLQVPGDVPLQEIVDKHILTGNRCLLVSSNGAPGGLLTLEESEKYPAPRGRPQRLRRRWSRCRSFSRLGPMPGCVLRSRKWGATASISYPWLIAVVTLWESFLATTFFILCVSWSTRQVRGVDPRGSTHREDC